MSLKFIAQKYEICAIISLIYKKKQNREILSFFSVIINSQKNDTNDTHFFLCFFVSFFILFLLFILLIDKMD